VNPPRDSVALFVVGAGTGIRQRAEEYKAKGEYLESHALQALAIEDRRRLRRVVTPAHPRRLGFPDPADMTMINRIPTKSRPPLQLRYRLPALEDQAGI